MKPWSLIKKDDLKSNKIGPNLAALIDMVK